MSENNPANEKKKRAIPEGFQPLSAPTQKLAVPEREGWHRRWIRGEPGRIAKAQKAGFRFVEAEEVEIKNTDLGGDALESGNTDMGTRVSVISGDGADASGQPGRLYLMECPQEFYEYSRGLIQDTNDSIAATLRGGNVGAEKDAASDRDKRYMKGAAPDLFTPKSRRS